MNLTSPVGEAVDFVYQTDDYDKFSFFDENRDVINSHVNQMVKSIESGKTDPLKWIIIVDPSTNKIVDGQNRFSACKITGRPFRYVLAEMFDISDIATINSKQRNWSQVDYIRFYMSQGNESYARLYKFMQQTGIKAVYTAITLLKGDQNLSDSVSSGNLTLTKDEYINGLELFKYYDSLDVQIKKNLGYRFTQAYAAALHIDGVDKKRLIEKTNRNSYIFFENKRKLDSFTACLEYISESYNKGLSASKKIDMYETYKNKSNTKRGR